MLHLEGKKVGKLLVIRRSSNKRGNSYYWECICDCGNAHLAEGWKLNKGEKRPGIKSCGCGTDRTTHGMSKTRTYISWNDMKGRCQRESSGEVYEKYGGKGITICDRWMKFENFLQDMGERPPKTSLDRINPYGNYEPGNCRWVTDEIQRENTRKNYDLNR